MLKKLREQAGLSQKQLSDKLGMKTPQYVSNIERGLTLLSVNHFTKVSKILNVPKKTLVRHHMQCLEQRINKRLGIK